MNNKQYFKEYYKRNREKLLANSNEYNRQHPELRSQYYKAHKDEQKKAMKQRYRKLKKQGLKGFHVLTTPEIVTQLKEFYQGIKYIKTADTGIKAITPDDLVIAVQHGNGKPFCQKCERPFTKRQLAQRQIELKAVHLKEEE